MSSLVGRVSATAGAFSQKAVVVLKQKLRKISPALSLPKPLFTPILTCTLGRLGPDGDLGGEGIHVGADAALSGAFQTSRFRRRRNSRHPGILSIASRVDATCDDATAATEDPNEATCDDATAPIEETTAIEDPKGHVGTSAFAVGPCLAMGWLLTSTLSSMVFDRAVKIASVHARSLIFKWSNCFISAITALAVCGSHWVHGMFTSGKEYMKPWIERLKLRSEHLGYWAFISCLLFSWLSIAFFLHWEVQRWEFSTMVLADPQEATDGAFDPGGSFCHSLSPNTGLGCQLFLYKLRNSIEECHLR